MNSHVAQSPIEIFSQLAQQAQQAKNEGVPSGTFYHHGGNQNQSQAQFDNSFNGGASQADYKA